MNKSLTAVLSFSLLLGGCANTNNRDIGTVVGGVLGAAIGRSTGDSASSKNINMAIGATVGAVAGRYIGAQFDEQETKQIQSTRIKALETSTYQPAVVAKSGARYEVEAITPLPPLSGYAVAPAQSSASESLSKPRTQSSFESVPPGNQIKPSAPKKAVVASTAASPQQVQAAKPSAVYASLGECRLIKQKVTMPDGEVVTDIAKVCKRAPELGTWVNVAA